MIERLIRCVGLSVGVVLGTCVAAAAQEPADFVIKPPHANASELTVKDGVPKGTVHQFVMKSEDSKIYPGISKTQTGIVPYERPVNVYIPAQYKRGTPASFIVVQDGNSPRYRDIIPVVLDNLIHESASQ